MNDPKMPDWLLGLDHCVAQSLVGTKAVNLGFLHQQGFNVPPAMTIATFEPGRFGIQSEAKYLEEINKLEDKLPLIVPSDDGWAVRSSGTVEDLQDQSLAGRFETFYIENGRDLTNRVQQIWQSAQLASVGIESMAVIIQQLIEADYAGVGFSTDPISGKETIIVEWCSGKGNRLVDGEVSPWHADMSEPLPLLPENFSEEILSEIAAGISRLKALYGYDVDVEWAVRNGKLYWLQVRPLTTHARPKFVIDDELKAGLGGVWMRIRDCISPQKPLISSLNPGGHFDAPGWQSQLINHYHYIQMKSVPAFLLTEQEFDSVLDQWDLLEQSSMPMLDEWLGQLPGMLTDEEVEHLLADQVQLATKIFHTYMEPEFIQIREYEQKWVSNFVGDLVENKTQAESIIHQLSRGLDSTTTRKQTSLQVIASKAEGDSSDDIESTQVWQSFLHDFGYESASTHLLYIPTMRETPELIKIMIDQIRQSNKESEPEENWKAVFEDLVGNLDSKARENLEVHLHRLRRCLLRSENDDSLLQKASAVLRYTLLDIGRRLKVENWIRDCDDIFYLVSLELECFWRKNKNTLIELHQRIECRKQAFRSASHLSPPALIVNGRPMNPKSRVVDGLITGTAASPGLGRGMVVVISDPFQTLIKPLPRGAIIVVPVVTPALAYSLIGCAGLISEIGGMTSHGAIVAREMLVPAVIGIKGACSILKTGNLVELNGNLGEVRIIDL
jgi:pyruvate,water dikinase